MRKLAVVLVLVVAVAGAAAWLHLPTLIGIGPGYSAQVTCACVFVSGRSAASCARDLDPLARTLGSLTVVPETRSVTARSFGVHRTARYRDGFGCMLED